MKYSNDDILKRIEDTKKNKAKLTHITDKATLSTEDRLKVSFCSHFVRYANGKKMKLKDFSKQLDLPTSRLSEVMNYKITKFSLEQLIKYLNVLSEYDPRVREYLLLLECAAEIPPLKVTETKKLTRAIRGYVTEEPRVFAYV